MRTKLWQMCVVVGAMALTPVAWGQERGQRAERGARETRPEAGQRGERGAERGQRRGVNMAQRLEQMQQRVMEVLTEEQKPKAQALFAEARKQIEALQAELQQADVQRREVMQKITAELRELRQDLDALVTDEQKAKLREAMGAGQGTPGGGMIERLQNQLAEIDLTDDQKQKVQAITASFREKFEKIREESADDRQAMMQQMRDALQQWRQQINEVLTPEQQEKLRGAFQRGPRQGGERPARGEGRG